MKNIILTVLFLLVFSLPTFAQQADEETKGKVVQVIKQLFEGMKTNDSSKVAQTFHPLLSLHSYSFKNGKPQVRQESIADFLKAVAAPKAQGVVYDERILRYEVSIDGGLATVWTPYEFYIGDKFSHCGVNAFHCVLTESGWKISHITDTRRKEPCAK
ncbi:MAG: nuclear transport factor 2 family protein [Candidatus Kapabacteria bacterium]|nr:nuclear transport factor 2 family protein [Candidatus Kapabacteria bacterium]